VKITKMKTANGWWKFEAEVEGKDMFFSLHLADGECCFQTERGGGLYPCTRNRAVAVLVSWVGCASASGLKVSHGEFKDQCEPVEMNNMFETLTRE
jgi:hypothetical protein